MAFIPRIGNRIIESLSKVYVVKDSQGSIVARYMNLTSARKYARSISLVRDGITFSIWSGRGFTVSLGIRYRGGRGSGTRR